MASVEVSMGNQEEITEEDFLTIREKALKIQKRQNIQLQKFLSRLEIETLRLAFTEEKKQAISKFYLTSFDTADDASTFNKLLKMPLKEKAMQKFMKRLEGFHDIQAMLKELEKAEQSIDREAKQKDVDLSNIENEVEEELAFSTKPKLRRKKR